MTDAGGKVQREVLREKVSAGVAELLTAFDERALKDIRKALKRIEADRLTFEEFSEQLARERPRPSKTSRRSTAKDGTGLLRGWFQSLANAEGKVQRDQL